MLLSKDTDPVLRRFQLQFIATTMAFIAIVLAIVLAVASYMTFNQRKTDVDRALDAYSGRIHLLPVETVLGTLGDWRDYGFDLNDLSMDTIAIEGPADDRGPGEPRSATNDPLVATSAYLLDEEGDILITISNALSLDEDTIEDAIDSIRVQHHLGEGYAATGKIDTLNLYYQLRNYAGGYTIVFASGNYVDRGVFTLASTLGLVELVALFVFLALAIVMSRQVVRPVERAWRQQRQFVADASHELKTPLAVIRANNSLLMADPSTSVASQMQWVESTETEAKLMQDLVNDMLLLAQSENDQSQVVHSELDLSELVQGSVLQFESVAFERGVALESNVAPGVVVKGVQKDLNRLAGTLIDNACKYAQEGGSVSVKLERSGSFCRFSVHNTGEPIPEEDLPHVFDRFYRSDKARTREAGGFGLGLSIAKSIAEDHKGTIGVTSSVFEGTSFSVTLPVV